ncbi:MULTISPECIES: TonB-dependent siderophore receptor [unclassified Dyella]|uniref:TonB-dependent siderophore receptor n=1 Tax=unclassified Dyella TaxID=2634549 RepID=UPI000CAF04D1|nr:MULTISPECIES: TonB-dependent siderophore receptor [unclassified Dyella]MDR3447862.1 TonB-dependent siderophore receptor [Dyella sp.]PMQ03452.1 Ferrichrome-iron receptor [Dyella sp. AD56]
MTIKLLAGAVLAALLFPHAALAVTGNPLSTEAADAPTSESQAKKLSSVDVQASVTTLDAQTADSATKTRTPLIETPQVVSVVTQEQMRMRGAQSVIQALGYSAGIAGYGPDSRSDWYTVIRGFWPTIYLDGLQLPVTMNLASWITDPYQLERIDVLHGPSSVLYGQGEPGGTVDMVSKVAGGAPVHEVQFQLGDHARKQLAADYGGHLDAAGNWSYRVVALGRNQDVANSPFRSSRVMLAPSVAWKPSTDTSLVITANYLRDHANYAGNFLPAEGTILPSPYGRISPHTYTGDADFTKYHKVEYAFGYQFEHRFNDTWTFRQNTRYSRTWLDNNMVYGIGMAEDGHSIDRYAGIAKPDYRRLAIDNQMEGHFQTGAFEHTVLVGVDYQHQRTDDPENYALAPPIDLYNPVYLPIDLAIFAPGGANYPQDIRQTQKQLGLYAQDQIKYADHWVFVLSGRQDWSRLSSIDHAVPDATTARQNDHAFTGRAGVVYLADNGLAPYLSYSESFNPTTTPNAYGAPFRPTTGKQYEAGLRFQPPGGRTSLTAAVFQIRQQNVLTPNPDQLSFPNGSLQTGEVRSRGVELEARTAFGDGFNLLGAYTYQDVRNTKANDNTLNKWPTSIPIPHELASVWADYTIPQGDWAGLGVGTGVRYTSSSRGAPDNSLHVPGYTLIDATAFYQLPQWRLALNLSNLANKVYVAGCYDATRCIYGPGRTAMLTATYDW